MKRRILACLLGISLLSGCGNGQPQTEVQTETLPVTELQTETEAAETKAAETAEILTEAETEQTKTMSSPETEPAQTLPAEASAVEPVREPPADGWTTEELTAVTTICGHELSLPVTMEDLGPDFTLKSYDQIMAAWHLEPGTLCYRGKQLARITGIYQDQKTNLYSFVLRTVNCDVTEAEPVSVNGVKLYARKEDAKAALGEPWHESDDALMYNDRETNNSLISLFFEDGLLVHYLIDFRFEITAPMYQNNQNDAF